MTEPKTFELNSDSLVSDVRDVLLDMFRGRQKPWQQMTESEQTETAMQAETAARHLVREAVEIIVAKDRPTIKGILDSIKIKDGILAVVKVSKDNEHRHALTDCTGSTVMLMVADPDAHDASYRPAETNPDQGDLEDRTY